jgi:hypothetical protein
MQLCLQGKRCNAPSQAGSTYPIFGDRGLQGALDAKGRATKCQIINAFIRGEKLNTLNHTVTPIK